MSEKDNLELLGILEEVASLIESYCDDHNSGAPTDVTVVLPRLQAAIRKAKGNDSDDDIADAIVTVASALSMGYRIERLVYHGWALYLNGRTVSVKGESSEIINELQEVILGDRRQPSANCGS